jgi:hypothetical protein
MHFPDPLNNYCLSNNSHHSEITVTKEQKRQMFLWAGQERFFIPTDVTKKRSSKYSLYPLVFLAESQIKSER